MRMALRVSASVFSATDGAAKASKPSGPPPRQPHEPGAKTSPEARHGRVFPELGDLDHKLAKQNLPLGGRLADRQP